MKIFDKFNNEKISYTKIFLVIILLLTINIATYAHRDFYKEEKIGEKLAEKIEKKYDFIEEQALLNKIENIGLHLKECSEINEINYRFKIIDKKGPNAFSIPGGFIYLTADLIDYIHSDDELAAVIAHEMGHIIHQHSIKQMKDNRKLKIVELFAILLTKDPAMGLLSELASITILNNYRREYEEEADLTALNLLMKSPVYNPVALLTYFERVNSEYLLKHTMDLGIFQTHPDIEKRVESVKKYLLENGHKINRRLTTNYLTVNGELEYRSDSLKIAKIFINEEEIFFFSGTNKDNVREKMEEVIYKLDKSLKLDLEPYEISIFCVNEGNGILRIGNEKIVTLSEEEINFQKLTVEDILEKSKKKISDIMWKIKLELPVLLINK